MEIEVKTKGRRTVTTGYSMSPELKKLIEKRAQSMNTNASQLVIAVMTDYLEKTSA